MQKKASLNQKDVIFAEKQEKKDTYQKIMIKNIKKGGKINGKQEKN
jgi:hypothetical protein